MQCSITRNDVRFLIRLRSWCAMLLAGVIMHAHAAAHSGEPPHLPSVRGETLLVIEGAITHTNHNDGTVHLDTGLIQQLPPHTLSTSTAVMDGVRRFDGVLMRDLLELVGAHGTMVEAHAHNGYAVDIPVSDFYDFGVLVATHMDGEQLRLSGKGPLWIVYPRDVSRKLQDIRYDYRWVWQLNRLTVK